MRRIPPEIESAFHTGALILTANVRAARWLRREHAELMRREGRQAWITPPIEDWDSWVRRLWESASPAEQDPPLLLTDLQERQVWLRMQRDDARLLVSPAGMAQLAAEAYALLCSHEASAERNRAWSHAPDAERFRHWADAFDRECHRQGWLSRSHLEVQVTQALRKGRIVPPTQVVLTGFDRLTPARKTLLASLRARGTTVEESGGESVAPQLRLLQANGLRDEITACAWWTRQLLETSPGEIRIGIAVPDLRAVRGEVERIFRRVLMPETDDIAAAASAMPFEFSLGQPLASVPVVRAALRLLGWTAAPLPEEEVSWLLLSGFLTGSKDPEGTEAARFDAARFERGSLSPEIALPAFRAQLDPARWPLLKDLYERLVQIEKIIAANNFAEEREPGRWVDLAQALLRQAGWPGTHSGGRRPDTLHFQAIARWERALEEIALLDFDGRKLGFARFLSLLAAHCEDTLFAAESQGAPVQILGALEASGQRFDALWFLGADDRNWPLRGRMHPLLPADVQRSAEMPHSTPQADFDLSRAVTASLAASAPLVVISNAARNRDGELRPSPLIGLLAPGATWERSPDSQPKTGDIAEMVEIADAAGTIPWPGERSAGGADVLAHQAACPFRAFTTKRLLARLLNRSSWGLDAAARGSLLHQVLQKLWSPDSENLHSLDDLLAAKRAGTLSAIVQKCIHEVFADKFKDQFEDSAGDPWLRAYLDGEKYRLAARIVEWLEVEAGRAPFQVIACEEELKDVSVGALRLRLRADRIDEVAGYQRLLIDYKTGGQVAVADWDTPRPREPQLPLYAAFGQIEDVCGVLFARIRAGESCLIGKVKDAKTQLFPNASGNSAFLKYPYSNALHDEWSEALLELAADFLRGEAAVDPRDGAATCEHCPLPGLCRIAERPAALAATDAEPDDD